VPIYIVFMQGIDKDGQQTEIPDPWLTGSNPWEVPRLDNTVSVKLYGTANREASGPNRWTGGVEVLVRSYFEGRAAVPVPGP
jgi:starch phosphorylase